MTTPEQRQQAQGCLIMVAVLFIFAGLVMVPLGVYGLYHPMVQTGYTATQRGGTIGPAVKLSGTDAAGNWVAIGLGSGFLVIGGVCVNSYRRARKRSRVP